ncbi:hypothetical protein [uncultured Rhodospira sp.]|uniref:hypothetical protein n=1 Tax=uncultured Rhodospira sp. TaxID=1936189 RepID=UPI002626C4F9|nr:hypothetical protein [uncultured Rhodospira sp.]
MQQRAAILADGPGTGVALGVAGDELGGGNSKRIAPRRAAGFKCLAVVLAGVLAGGNLFHLRFPRRSGHRFRQHPDTGSTTIRTPIPPTSGHRFHEHPDTGSTNIRTPIPRASGHP